MSLNAVQTRNLEIDFAISPAGHERSSRSYGSLILGVEIRANIRVASTPPTAFKMRLVTTKVGSYCSLSLTENIYTTLTTILKFPFQYA